MGQGPAGAAESRRANGKGVNRRKGKGKGRMMMSASSWSSDSASRDLPRGTRSLTRSPNARSCTHSQDLLRPQFAALPLLVRTNAQHLLAPPARLNSLIRLPLRPRPVTRALSILSIPCSSHTSCAKPKRDELLVYGEVVGAGLGTGYRWLVGCAESG